MTTAAKVLIVDDEPAIVDLLSTQFTRPSFDVTSAADGRAAINLVRKDEPDVVILDLGLPGTDGLDVLREVRAHSAVPVIVLTARDSDADKIQGLLTGADDYVTKPFNPAEVVARAQAQIRRSRLAQQHRSTSANYQRGDLLVDFDRNLATMAGERVILTRTEWTLMCELAMNPGRVLTHDELLERSWGAEYKGEVQYLRVWVSRLRKKLADATGSDDWVQTVAGIGYMLAAPDAAPAANPS